jgi:plastocyanin
MQHARDCKRRIIWSFVFAATLVMMALPAQAATVRVAVLDNRFVPERITVVPGDTIIWTNVGTTMHTVSAKVGFLTLFDFELSPGEPAVWLVTGIPLPSSFRYVCLFHFRDGMVGWITIQR